MTRRICTIVGTVLLSCLIALAITMTVRAGHDSLLRVPAASAGEPPSAGNSWSSNPCAPPTSLASTPQETAWRLWVAATCPVNPQHYPYVVWENWIEQAQMYPPDPANGLKVPNAAAEAHGRTRQFRHSPLALARAARAGQPLQLSDENCHVANDPPPNNPTRVICEEVRLTATPAVFYDRRHQGTPRGAQTFASPITSADGSWNPSLMDAALG
jgi:hypothetical protein